MTFQLKMGIVMMKMGWGVQGLSNRLRQRLTDFLQCSEEEELVAAMLRRRVWQ